MSKDKHFKFFCSHRQLVEVFTHMRDVVTFVCCGKYAGSIVPVVVSMRAALYLLW